MSPVKRSSLVLSWLAIAAVAFVITWLWIASTREAGPVGPAQLPATSSNAPGAPPDSAPAPARSPVKAPRTAPAVNVASTSTRSLVHGLVRSRSGDPVPGARVFHLDRDGKILTATTSGEDGRFRLESPRVPKGRLVARAAGYGPGFADDTRTDSTGGATEATEIEIVLGQEGFVEGRVVLVDGSPPGIPLEVVAWRADSDRLPSADLCDAVRSYHPTILHTETRTDGTFRIGGFESGALVLVSGGGKGYTQTKPNGVPDPVEAIAGGAPITVHVAPLYALRVELRDEDGGSLRSAPQLFSYPFPTVSRPKGALLTEKSLPGAWLNPGVAFEDPPTGRSDRLYLIYAGTHDSPALAETDVTASAPGYEPWVGTVPVRRVPEGLTPQIVRLKRTTAAFGRLRLRFTFPRAADGTSLWQPGDRTPLPFGIVKLRPARDDGPAIPPFEATLAHSPDPSLDLNGVPAGTYSVWVKMDAFGDGPVERVVVPAGGDATATVSTGDWGAVEATVVRKRNGAEEPYAGLVVLSLVTAGPKPVGGMQAFDEAPYRFLGVQPGVYRVMAIRQAYVSEESTVDVRAGEIARVRLRIDEDGAGAASGR